MTYGLLPTGFKRKTAAEIRADIVASITSIAGLENARTTTGSVLGNLIDVFVNELSIAWEGIEATVHAFNRDSASGQALDAIASLIGKSRFHATHTSVELYLWGNSTTVLAGNQAVQSSTGVLFETLADAIIPADTLNLSNLDITTIEWQSGTTVRYSFAGSPNLSSVTPGHLFYVSGSAYSANAGAYIVTAVNNTDKWVEVSNPARTDNTLNELSSPGVGLITDGFTSVPARSVLAGEYIALAQSIDTINTPVIDWNGVANIADGIAGRNVETDAEFRSRIKLELTIANGSTLEAVKQKIRQIPGVTYVSAIENRMHTYDSLGQAPHSQTFAVVGGQDQDIIDTIGAYKAAGIETNGSTVGTYTDPEGNTFTIRFKRPTLIYPWIEVTLTTDSNYPTNGHALVEQALIDYGETLDAGEDLLNYRLIEAIASSGVPGILTIQVLQGLVNPPTSTANIPISPTEICRLIAARITVLP